MKTLLSLLTVLFLPFAAMSQQHSFRSFLNVRAILTGTNSLGTLYGVTNLQATVTNTWVIHNTNVLWTNMTGQIIRSAGTGTNSITIAALFNDVPLYPDRDGRTLVSTAVGYGYDVSNSISGLTLFAKVVGPWLTNGPIGIVFCPVWDGVGGTTPTSRVDDWAVVIPGGWYSTTSTNVPLWRWPGAAALRVRYITNQFTGSGVNDASLTNSPAIVKLGIAGFVP